MRRGLSWGGFWKLGLAVNRRGGVIGRRDSPDGHHDFVFLAVVRFSSSKPGFVHLARDVARLDGLVVDEDLLGVDITDVHLASSGHQGRAVRACAPAGGAWGSWPGAWIGGLLGGGSGYGGEDGCGLWLAKVPGAGFGGEGCFEFLVGGCEEAGGGGAWEAVC